MGTIYTVSSREELYEALANAQGGDEIQLASGDYGKLSLWAGSGFNVAFESPVKITSADLDSPASFSEMLLDSVSNLTFENVLFDYEYKDGDATYSTPFEIRSSSNIVISNSIFDGDVAQDVSEKDDGYGFARGLLVRNSENITLTDNEMMTWYRGLVVMESNGLNIAGNELYNMRSDGMNFSEVQNVLIEENYIHDFQASPNANDHRDMIQFWTNGTDEANSNIIIRNNVLDIGEGDQTQSIFMRNEEVDTGRAGEEMYYQDVLIEGNIILNGHAHGITVGESIDLVIQNNTLLSVGSDDDRYLGTPVIKVASNSQEVTITGNAVAAINGAEDNDEFLVSNNAFIQNEDSNGIGYYGDQFITSSQNGLAASYIVTPDSMIDKLGAGAPQLALVTTPEALIANFSVFSEDGTEQALVFDASHTFSELGNVTVEDAKFEWNLGDGTFVEGMSGAHKYSSPGHYEVSLKVTLNGSEISSTSTATVSIPGKDLITFDGEDGELVSQLYGLNTSLETSSAALSAYNGGYAIDLGASGSVLEINKGYIEPFFGSDDFQLSMTLQADQPGVSKGEVVRINGSLVIGIKEDGNIWVQVSTAFGDTVKLNTSNQNINDGASHEISLALDKDSDTISLVVDGQLTTSKTFVGTLPGMSSSGITFGNPWGKQNFDGKITAFDLDASSSDYSSYDAPIMQFSPIDEISFEPALSEPEATLEDQDTLPETKPTVDGDSPEEHTNIELDDYILNVETLSQNTLKVDAAVLEGYDGKYIDLSGEKDYVNLGRLKDFEGASEIAFSTEFSKENADDGDMRLVWNHMNIGLAVDKEGLRIYVNQADKAFHNSIVIRDLGLDDTETHSIYVAVDDEQDRLQVVLDGEIVHDEIGVRDFNLVEAGAGYQWGWTLGSEWSHQFEGEIYDFRLEADADFMPDEGTLIA